MNMRLENAAPMLMKLGAGCAILSVLLIMVMDQLKDQWIGHSHKAVIFYMCLYCLRQPAEWSLL